MFSLITSSSHGILHLNSRSRLMSACGGMFWARRSIIVLNSWGCMMMPAALTKSKSCRCSELRLFFTNVYWWTSLIFSAGRLINLVEHQCNNAYNTVYCFAQSIIYNVIFYEKLATARPASDHCTCYSPSLAVYLQDTLLPMTTFSDLWFWFSDVLSLQLLVGINIQIFVLSLSRGNTVSAMGRSRLPKCFQWFFIITLMGVVNP